MWLTIRSGRSRIRSAVASSSTSPDVRRRWVTRVIVGRTHRPTLEPRVLGEAADWMDRQRALWGRLFDVVDEYLKEDRPQ